MENKRKILITIGLIIVFIICFIIYIINNKANNKIDLNNFVLGESEENYIEEYNENEEIVNKVEEKITKIAVHIIGEVKKSGIIYLQEGARLIDAIEKAGGETDKADLTQVNLAYKLQDGEKILIPSKKEKIKEYIIAENGNNSSKEEEKGFNNLKGESKKVNINTATQSELDSLPGIGPSTAQKIINYRKENGKFKKIEELQEIKGIGDAKFKEIKDKITV